MVRTRAERRELRNKHIRRKKNICTKAYGWDWYKHDGQYSKGKIHCSCKMCKYGRHYGLPTIRDEREKELVDSHFNDYYKKY